MDEAIESLRQLVSVPVLTGLPFGHIARRLTLPFGSPATLDIERDRFSLDFPMR